MFLIQQTDITHLIPVLMIQTADHITGLTAATLTVTKSKNGGAFAAWSGTIAEIANGWYALTPAAGDVDTLGALTIHVTATSADPKDVVVQVVAFNPNAAMDVQVLDGAAGIETGWTVRQAIRQSLRALAAKVNGGGTTTVNIRDMADLKNAVTATVDANGNRTAVTHSNT